MCNKEYLEYSPFFYACDFFGCDQSETCVACFREAHSNWEILDHEWRYYFKNEKINGESDVFLYKNIKGGVCPKAHELIYCQG